VSIAARDEPVIGSWFRRAEDHRPQPIASPREIIAELQIADPANHEAAIPSAARRDGSDESSATSAN
jgi:hypothetical protein